MKLFTYRGSAPNFGDELNTWLLPRVFPNFFDNDDTSLFLGIGSVIFNNHDASSKKIVFGSGYAGYTALPVFDSTWKFYCVRGPNTAKSCDLPASKVAGDTAILVRGYRKKSEENLYPFSFIPHWESLSRGNWARACDAAGIHLIDPRAPVEEVLAAIEKSEIIITEAMHGAIVADALRIPWISMLPIRVTHRWKWFDWAGALDLNIRQHWLMPSSTRELWSLLLRREGEWLASPPSPVKGVVGLLDRGIVHAASGWLRHAKTLEPMLSRENALASAHEKLLTCAELIRRGCEPA